MKIAIWIIAICEVIRMLQNSIQLRHIKHNQTNQDNAYSELIKSFKRSDREFVKQMLEAYEAMEGENEQIQDTE